MEDLEQRILVHTLLPRDADLISKVLTQVGLVCRTCASFQVLMAELSEGAAVVLTVEEVLASRSALPLYEYVGKQPQWSDLPILVLTKPGGDSHWVDQAFERLGNLTLLERPIRTSTLISAARSALRARRRQYDMRLADQRKDEFLAMLAHELRNPLAPIGAAAQLLDIVHADAEQVKHSSRIIGRQVKHMTSLIDDLLDVARVTRGLVSLDKEPLDIANVLTQAVEQAAPLIRQRKHQLALHLPEAAALVLGDEKRLVQVFANVLTNAAKYTPDAGTIGARLVIDERSVHVEISDNGIGMTPEMIGHVFDLFSQAERDSARSQGGLGLGLALVRNLLKLHDGTIAADSEGLGCGSTFTITLPRHHQAPRPAALPVQGSQHQQAPSQPLRILVVDDNVDAANMLELLLSALGHVVHVAYLASHAMETARNVRPQVCLIDIGLPDMNGNILASQLRTMPEVASSLMIAVTGYGQYRDVRESHQAGFDEHLVKPVDMRTLEALLAKAGTR